MEAANDLRCRLAKPNDAAQIHAIRVAAADDLTRRFGSGHWSHVSNLRTIRKHVTDETVWVGARASELVATLRITDSKIGFYRSAWFSDPKARAGYLMHMAVGPDHQRFGCGATLLREAEGVAMKQGLECVRLDSYDAPAGAGSFYAKAGYTHVYSGEVNGVPLQYWEKLLQ